MSETFTLIDCDPKGNTRVVEVPAAGIRAVDATEDVRISPDALRDALGWKLEPAGLCRDEICVPVADRAALATEEGVSLSGFAHAVGQPLALDVAERVAVFGTSLEDRRRVLDAHEAPDFTLPDLTGKLHSLSDHRGKKVLLIAYASW